MNRSAAFGLAFAISAVSVSAAFATDDAPPVTHAIHRHHRVHHRIPAARDAVAAGSAAQSATPTARPPVPPAVQNDSDGLSLDPENCNMGCLGNTE